VVDASWNPGADSDVLALVTDSEGFIYVGGQFSTLGGQARLRLGAVDDAGALDGGWVVDANSTVSGLKIMQGEVYAGGAFTALDGDAHLRLAAISSAGATSPGVVRQSFGVNSAINSIDAGRDFIVIGGTFQKLGSATRSRIAAVSRTALLPFNPVANGTVSGVSVAGNAVAATGSFTSLNGAASRAGIVNVFHSSHGVVDEGLSAAASTSLVAGGLHFVGGSFTNASSQGELRSGLFVFSAD
jgi:hypothetical protein